MDGRGRGRWRWLLGITFVGSSFPGTIFPPAVNRVSSAAQLRNSRPWGCPPCRRDAAVRETGTNSDAANQPHWSTRRPCCLSGSLRNQPPPYLCKRLVLPPQLHYRLHLGSETRGTPGETHKGKICGFRGSRAQPEPTKGRLWWQGDLGDQERSQEIQSRHCRVKGMRAPPAPRRRIGGIRLSGQRPAVSWPLILAVNIAGCASAAISDVQSCSLQGSWLALRSSQSAAARRPGECRARVFHGGRKR